ncbi:hypothetical protein [Streptomyces olivaceus]|uniref:hypothetical protein n=1 Tax=Streptomyces olivaceus TaxID=47716 RepID=UPI00367D68AF
MTTYTTHQVKYPAQVDSVQESQFSPAIFAPARSIVGVHGTLLPHRESHEGGVVPVQIAHGSD